MPNKPDYITFITDKLKSGMVEWSKVFAVFSRKFPTSRKTFDKYWKIANAAHKETQEAIEKEKAAQYTAAQLKANKELILSREKILEDLKKDIDGINKMINDGYLVKSITINGKSETKKELFGISEIRQLHQIKDNKITIYKNLEGYDKPTKIANTDTQGNDIKQDFSSFTNEELAQFSLLQKKIIG